MTPCYFPEEHDEEWGVMTLKVPSKDGFLEPVTNERLPPVSVKPLVSQAVAPSDVSLPVSFLPDVTQPASRANQSPLPISRPVTSADLAAPSSSVQLYPLVPLQDRTVAPINTSGSVFLVKLVRSADRGHSFTGRALDFLRHRLALREEEFVALDERYLKCEERFISLDADIEFLTHENRLLKDAVFKLELDLYNRVSEISSLQSRVAALECRSTVLLVKLLSLTNKRDRYRRLLCSLTHQFDYLDANFCRVVTEARSGRADV